MSQINILTVQPYFVALTFLGVLFLIYNLVPYREGLSMPGGTNNLAFTSLVDHPGSSTAYASMRGREGMLGIDAGPTNWGPTDFAEVANSQVNGSSDTGEDSGAAWDNVTRVYKSEPVGVGTGKMLNSKWNVEGMGNRILGSINVEGMRATLNPY